MRRGLALTLTVLTMVACQQDPYADKHAVQGPQPPPPPPAQKPAPPPKGAWGLKVEDEMDFTEGQKNVYPISGQVPTPGHAQIAVHGLPAGASFDSATGNLSWTPDYQAANDPANPLATSRIYPVEVELTSDVEPNSSIVRRALIVVKDSPQPANIQSPLQINGMEGSTLTHVLAFNDNEFPKGPFEVSLTGFPAGTTLNWPDRTQSQFQLNWTPDNLSVINKSVQNYGGHVVIFNPRGRRLEFDVVWSIANVLLNPNIAGPTDVAQSGDVSFALMADDPNRETAPQWQAVNPPPDGVFQLSPMALSGSSTSTAAVVTWKRIPANRLNRTYSLTLQACVRGSYCAQQTVNIVPSAGGK